ncbi:MAG: DUF1349 domain-containing protein [Acidimicrobiia bacterium]
MNEPPQWNTDGDTLTMRTGPKTDFWCRTMQDVMSPQEFAEKDLEPPEFLVDTGHFYYEVVKGDFTLTAQVGGDYNYQYDQVGLYIRQDADTWLKACVEVVYGSWSPRYTYSNPAHIVACTHTVDGWSGWSPLPESENNPPTVWFRVTRSGDTFFVDYSETGERWDLIKVFSMPGADELMVGVYATSPNGFGFDARIEHFSLVGDPS